MLGAAAAAEILDALRGYFWLLLAALVVWRLFPVIRRRVESEDFSVEIAGQKVSFQSASSQLHKEVDDVRSQLIALAELVEGQKDERADEDAGDALVEAEATPEVVPGRPVWILWVDDRPQNNAFLIKSLKDRGAEVIEAASTDEALAELASNRRRFDVVISDMGRKEPDGYRPLAGVDLVRRIREDRLAVPIVIYASPRAVERGGDEALEAGAAGVTASPTELLTMLRIGPTTEFEAAVADIVRRHFGATPFPIRGAVDFVAENGTERVGIEIKNWASNPRPSQFERTLRDVSAARERFQFDRILIVTRAGVDIPPGLDLPPWLAVQTVDELVASLAT